MLDFRDPGSQPGRVLHEREGGRTCRSRLIYVSIGTAIFCLVDLELDLLQCGPGTKIPSWASQILNSTASIQPVAPGATPIWVARTGILGLKYLLKKLARLLKSSGSPQNPLGKLRCWIHDVVSINHDNIGGIEGRLTSLFTDSFAIVFYISRISSRISQFSAMDISMMESSLGIHPDSRIALGIRGMMLETFAVPRLDSIAITWETVGREYKNRTSFFTKHKMRNVGMRTLLVSFAAARRRWFQNATSIFALMLTNWFPTLSIHQIEPIEM